MLLWPLFLKGRRVKVAWTYLFWQLIPDQLYNRKQLINNMLMIIKVGADNERNYVAAD